MTSEVPTAATPPARPRGAAVLRGVHGVASLRALTTAFESEGRPFECQANAPLELSDPAKAYLVEGGFLEVFGVPADRLRAILGQIDFVVDHRARRTAR